MQESLIEPTQTRTHTRVVCGCASTSVCVHASCMCLRESSMTVVPMTATPTALSLSRESSCVSLCLCTNCTACERVAERKSSVDKGRGRGEYSRCGPSWHACSSSISTLRHITRSGLFTVAHTGRVIVRASACCVCVMCGFKH